MVSGISSKKLKNITISNNTDLWELLLPNLSSAENISITNNPKLLYLEKTFPNLGRVEKSLQVEESNMVNLKLPVVEKIESCLISNNPHLARIEMPFLVQGSMAITSSGNPMYASLQTASGEKSVVDVPHPRLAGKLNLPYNPNFYRRRFRPAQLDHPANRNHLPLTHTSELNYINTNIFLYFNIHF
ncbi:hypothetical protein DSO57_1039367 [Entomophthora muscae]|uniref:Uncharacterized protein n=1 Tax=Entomophthora muscae TaxID=34485 RepID=A0ACC2TX77_9FUNG|nr:hypothetical protein DSO57_1039367 [Entomophthora muscae]